MVGIISAFHEGNKKNFLIDMDATMWILSTEGIAGLKQEKNPATARIEGIAGQNRQKHPATARIGGIAGQTKQKHPPSQPDGGYKRTKQATIPNRHTPTATPQSSHHERHVIAPRHATTPHQEDMQCFR